MSIFDTAFNRPESFFKTVPALKGRQMIAPEDCADPANPPRRMYATGVGLAIGFLLTGELSVAQNPEGTEFTVRYPSKSLGTVIGVSRRPPQGAGTPIQWSSNLTTPFLHMASACALTVASGLLDAAHFPLTHAALRRVAGLTGFPVRQDELTRMAEQNPLIVGAIHHLSDAVYSEASALMGSRAVVASQTQENRLPTLTGVSPQEIAKLLGVWREAVVIPKNTPKEQLFRLTHRGGSALLVGPPATFKTTAARKVAVARQFPVVEMQGNTGVEDRDLLGTFLRAPGGETTWVDGPLPQIFSYAAQGPVMAIIDEIMRFIPETTSIFITVMNQLDYEDCELLLRPCLEHPSLKLSPAQVQEELDLQLPERGERYHMLKLPTGDVMFALVRHFTWVATTNLGDSYIQAAAGLDPALMSRFDLVIEVPRADPDDVLPIYEFLAGPHPDLARFAAELEDFSYEEMKEDNGLFKSPLDPRKMIAFIKESRGLLAEGRSFNEAVLMACAPTVVPHVCPRGADGVLDPVALERIYSIVTDDVLPNY
ncbi:AAA family ATPase [Deinococcus marmoris]|uniref:ATPase dynein-related AAA domain-containing protein n=1 Tax=Deinococcus marmoris TaxID=249408 RepID=A0A1U7NTG6_9DEIO|nr:AAA family ATPase [Deinococcus marmoris]OLV16219.1 hypothetical protein BOO71_0012505 [Deinococcus marmoris]